MYHCNGAATKTKNKMKRINTNDKITVRFVTDADLRPTVNVLERKGKFVTIQISQSEIVKRMVHTSLCGNYEYCFPYGKYSMAPIARHN